jgi:hypothetical protein
VDSSPSPSPPFLCLLLSSLIIDNNHGAFGFLLEYLEPFTIDSRNICVCEVSAISVLGYVGNILACANAFFCNFQRIVTLICVRIFLSTTVAVLAWSLHLVGLVGGRTSLMTVLAHCWCRHGARTPLTDKYWQGVSWEKGRDCGELEQVLALKLSDPLGGPKPMCAHDDRQVGYMSIFI